MKNIAKLLSLVLINVLTFGITSCTEEFEYTKATVPANQVYFGKDQATTIDIDKNAGSFDINVYRVDSVGELTVPVTFTASEGNIYNVPSSVTFANGKKVAPLHITFDSEKVEYGEYTGGTITLSGEGFDSTYGISSLAFTAGATEWVPFDENNSVGLYREDMVTTFFGVENVMYNVYMEKSKVRPGMYRMKNVYGAAYPYNEDGDYDTSKDYYWVINATDPDYVYFETYESEMTWSYGQFIFGSLVSYNLDGGVPLETIKANKPEWFGTLRNGVITMPQKSMFSIMTEYNPDAPYYGNVNGMLAVALPGAKIADYTIGCSYAGRYTDPDENDFALVDITMGEDVASVKYTMVPEGVDLNATLNGMIDGSVEAQSVTEPGQVQIPYTETGKYGVLLVGFDNEGVAQSAYAIIVKLRSSKDALETWTDVAAGQMTLGAKDLSYNFFGESIGCITGDEPISYEAIMSQSSIDPTRFRLAPYIFDDTPLYFNVLANGQIIMDQEESGFWSSETDKVYVSDCYSYILNVEKDEDFANMVVEYNLHSYYSAERDLYVFQEFFWNKEGIFGVQRDLFEVSARAAKAVSTAMAKAKQAAKEKKLEKRVASRPHFLIKNNAKLFN
ncbi:MAG: hypothetical protein ACI3Y5_06590 [Prevotella sp.]